jgi:CheY-like chemotaxis protein
MPISTVLLVDDDADIRMIGKLSIEGVGKWRVLMAASGPEGVDVAARERPDVILLDVMMPLVDGPSVLEALRRRPETAAIPVIFMTAKAQKYEIERYRELGATGVITKPFDPMKLPGEIRRIVEATG